MPRYHLNPRTGDPGACSAMVKCPFGDLDKAHYDSPEEARAAYEAKQVVSGEAASAKPLDTPHDKPEDQTTGKGTKFSKGTHQADGRIVMTVNGHDIVIHPVDKWGFHQIDSEGAKIGTLFRNKAKNKWEITYADGSAGRSQRWPADANAALVKKAFPEKKAKAPSDAAPKGYDPATSELNLYDDFRTNKARTVGRLRRLATPDLVRMYNSLAHAAHNGHYTDEILSDQAAMKRVKNVLAERGEDLEIASHGELRPGYDYGTAESYKLKDK